MTETPNAEHRYTDRCSSRVASPGDRLPDQGQIESTTGQEGMTSSALAASATPPESGGRQTSVLLSSSSVPVRPSLDRLLSVRSSLSPRDWLVLGSFEQHPYLTTLHLQRLHFADHATLDAGGRVCRRVLRRLADTRVIEHLERRVGGVRAGSASFVWRVGPVGDRLLRERRGAAGRARRQEPSLRYLEHCLLAAETHIQLLEAGARHDLDVIHVETEPTCWRPYLAPGPARHVLKPDLYAVTSVPKGDYEDHWFIEIDRATENQPTLLRKCVQYDEYRRTGTEQQRHGVFPLTLWVMPDQQRIDRFRQSLRDARSVDSSLHRTTTLSGLLAAVTGEPV